MKKYVILFICFILSGIYLWNDNQKFHTELKNDKITSEICKVEKFYIEDNGDTIFRGRHNGITLPDYRVDLKCLKYKISLNLMSDLFNKTDKSLKEITISYYKNKKCISKVELNSLIFEVEIYDENSHCYKMNTGGLNQGWINSKHLTIHDWDKKLFKRN